MEVIWRTTAGSAPMAWFWDRGDGSRQAFQVGARVVQGRRRRFEMIGVDRRVKRQFAFVAFQL